MSEQELVNTAITTLLYLIAIIVLFSHVNSEAELESGKKIAAGVSIRYVFLCIARRQCPNPSWPGIRYLTQLKVSWCYYYTAVWKRPKFFFSRPHSSLWNHWMRKIFLCNPM